MHWLYKLLLLVIVLNTTITSFGQGRYYNDKRKGQLTISWGWNRDAYTQSNINFKGDDYDFKLYHVKAHDKPTLPISFKNYLQFSRLTIPQTNLRISYFIKDNLALSFGDDHMKYVMTQDQTARIKGAITQNGNYKGTYDGDMVLTDDFLTFEHTDGLNYLNIEIEKYYTWYHSSSNKVIISGMYGGGAGVLFPKTNVKLLNYERNDRFHVSGFGLSAKAGVQLTLLKHLAIKIENKYGYLNMPDIILHKKGIPGRAKQAFFFAEIYGTIGATFNLKGSKKKQPKNQKDTGN
ncbi:MAG TPA: hypothetical protein PKC72_03395 [Chitinophagaceae bacterium]|nr:hypothetical protein [Chitinophagaceae bacterium]